MYWLSEQMSSSIPDSERRIVGPPPLSNQLSSNPACWLRSDVWNRCLIAVISTIYAKRCIQILFHSQPHSHCLSGPPSLFFTIPSVCSVRAFSRRADKCKLIPCIWPFRPVCSFLCLPTCLFAHSLMRSHFLARTFSFYKLFVHPYCHFFQTQKSCSQPCRLFELNCLTMKSMNLNSQFAFFLAYSTTSKNQSRINLTSSLH